MSTLRTLRKLVFGETWLLPLGVAAIVLLAALLVKPALSGAWRDVGGFVLVAGVLCLLVVSVARGARRR